VSELSYSGGSRHWRSRGSAPAMGGRADYFWLMDQTVKRWVLASGEVAMQYTVMKESASKLSTISARQPLVVAVAASSVTSGLTFAFGALSASAGFRHVEARGRCHRGDPIVSQTTL
jgi:hypothetical protein